MNDSLVHVVATTAAILVLWLIAQNLLVWLWLPRLVRAFVQPLTGELRDLRTSVEGRLDAIERANPPPSIRAPAAVSVGGPRR